MAYTESRDSLNFDEKDDLDVTPFLDGGGKSHRRPKRWAHGRHWIFLTFVFATTSVLQVMYHVIPLKQTPGFQTGFSTELCVYIDLGAAPVQVHFSGGLKFDDNGTLYRHIDSDQLQYVGAPTIDIDQNWENLQRDRLLHFASNEEPTIGNSYVDPNTGEYRLGVDTFHTLHCLNQIRMEIDKDHYQPGRSEGPHNHRLHIEHCLDYIRQALMCYTDLTPLPVIWSETAERTYVDFEVTHTCRNFDSVRAWATEHIGETF